MCCINGTTQDCIGSGLALNAGTYIVTYNVSLATSGSVTYQNVYSGLSYANSGFTAAGFSNNLFQKNVIMSGVTTSSGQSFTGVQTFCLQNTGSNIYLVCCTNFSAGVTPSLLGSTSVANGLVLPPCSIIATRIA